jgi:pimeloyl-ACP methyl ester carboxylesterase
MENAFSGSPTLKLQTALMVHVYLIAANNASDSETVKKAGFLELGSLKGNIGDQNYDVPADADLAKYRAVTIWCKRFSVNFGTAPLNSSSSRKGQLESESRQCRCEVQHERVVARHGWQRATSAHELLREVIRGLANNYRVIAPDLPGFGFTEVPRERKYAYSFDGLASTIRAFTEAH